MTVTDDRTLPPRAVDEAVPGLPLPLSGSTRVYAILGDPIGQVGSPGLFNAAFRRRGSGSVLVPAHVSPGDLEKAIDGLRRVRNLGGLIVTVPHKISVMGMLDEIGVQARRIGAVNAIRRMPDGRLVGDNFDGLGCVLALGARGQRIAGLRMLLIGCGGAGRALAHAFADEGLESLSLFDLDGARAGELAASLRKAVPDLSVTVATGAAADPSGMDLIVNATPLGMAADDTFPVPVARLDPSSLVVDIILKPAVSAFLQTCAAQGHFTMPGSAMLEGQIDAICDFFGIATGSGDER